uniref:GntR family transcriptional regulator n=1 Tax=Paractinoplanes polyasparticus TaxID=2856853 RepID=UPI001C8547DE|nr:GntR family transcriptional regulator [Actinoplanes polyasparticus]
MTSPVLRRGLADEAADRIRDAIFEGHFPPGATLREVELAASLGVSRGSVREGLTRLEHEGLIRTIWHRGTRVVDVTAADVGEVYTLRAALDRLAATTAHHAATSQQLAGLDALVTEMAAAVAAGVTGAQLVALDMAFHEAVYAAAGNTRLHEAWRALRSQVHLFQLRRVTVGAAHYRDRVITEHRELAELIREGDQETLAAVAEEHVHAARRALLADLPA